MLRLLVIEENEVDFFICANLLETEYPGKFRIVHASNLLDGLVLLENREFHAVLLDLDTRPGGGNGLVRKILKMTDTPIVGLGAKHFLRQREALMAAGLAGFVQKEKVTESSLGVLLYKIAQRGSRRSAVA